MTLLVLVACADNDGPRGALELENPARAQAPAATWAAVLDGRLAAPHCWTPHGEGAILAVGFDGSVEETAGVFALDATLDGFPLEPAPSGSGRFVALTLPDVGVAPGYHTVTVSGSVDAEITLLRPQPGDANCDGRFGSDDLVAMFESGHYESPDVDGEVGWAEGDFDGDGDVDSSDLVAAYTAGNYESALPYADAGEASWVLRPGALGTMTASPIEQQTPSIVDVLEGTTAVEVVVTADDFDPAENLYSVAFPLQELPEFRIGVRLAADEAATLDSAGGLTVAIDFAGASFTTADRFNLGAASLLDELDGGDMRTVCGDVWFRGDDGSHTFVGRGTTEPMQMLATTIAAEAKKAPRPDGGLGGLIGGAGVVKDVIELLPLDTCGVYVPFGVCPASVCAHSRGPKVAISYCDAGTYGVSPGAINLCACL